MNKHSLIMKEKFEAKVHSKHIDDLKKNTKAENVMCLGWENWCMENVKRWV